VGHNYSVRLMGPAGDFSIVDVDTGAVVSSGAVAQAWTWTDHAVPPNALQPGSIYRIVSAGGQVEDDSIPFSVSYRFGDDTTRASWSLSTISFDETQLVESNTQFSVYALLRWTGSNPMPSGLATAALNVGVLEPGIDPTAVYDGLVVLSSPLVTFPVKNWGPNAQLQASAYVDRMSLSGTAGLTLLFQYICVSPTGELLVSDIAGGTIASATSSLTGGTSSETVAERVQRWGRALAGANSSASLAFRRAFYAELKDR